MKKISIIACLGVIILGVIWYFTMLNPSFSVIVPVYNAERYLPQCLDSIFSQKGNFKVIAVNDGSSDKSLQILQEYAKKHTNLQIINQENKGVSAARNAGMKAADTEYITFIDSDDWFEPDAFIKALKIIKKDNPDILLTGYYDVYDQEWIKNIYNEEVAKKIIKEVKYRSRDLDELALFSPFYGEDASSSLFYAKGGVRARFFKRSFLKKYDIQFPEKIACYEDTIFTFRAFLNNPLISILTDPLHNYRNRVDSISKSENIIMEIPKSLGVMQDTLEFKQANRRTKMLINDSWLFLINLGIANLHRHGYAPQDYIDYVYNVYQEFSKYNKQDLETCRNYKILQQTLRNLLPNLPL